MELSSLNKVVSLHLQRCSGDCQNASVCYHKNKARSIYELKRNDCESLRIRLLEEGYKVHESVCEMDSKYYVDLAKGWSTYNITISCNALARHTYSSSSYEFRRDLINQIKEQVQISVYYNEEVQEFKEFQKLYLIRDNNTLDHAEFLMKQTTGRLHFLFDKTFLLDKAAEKIVSFTTKFQRRADSLQSADTCLTSWLVNGHCPYDKDYLDITFDKTARKCPYAKKGIDMVNLELDSIKAYMDISLNYHHVCDPIFKCIYKDTFKGEGHEQFEGADIQNQAANNGDGSNSKRMRRFSLRR